MNDVWQMLPVLLLLLLASAVSIGIGLIVVFVRRSRWKALYTHRPTTLHLLEQAGPSRRPNSWLAIKTRSLHGVQAALGLHNPKPCSWSQGLEENLFVSPPVKGWILVTGSCLPEPGEDVDATFRFVLGLSRRLGQVQFFCANRSSRHHAWVWAEGGHILRAYAWAGHTLWNQGNRTGAENELGLKCFGYGETAPKCRPDQPEPATLNIDRVPLLAARWSLDPAQLDASVLEKAGGIAGELSRRF